jgi:hypothetical protein
VCSFGLPVGARIIVGQPGCVKIISKSALRSTVFHPIIRRTDLNRFSTLEGDVIQRILLGMALLAISVFMIGCGAPATPAAAPATPTAQAAAPTAVVPAAGQTPLPQPAQPTSPAQPTRVPSPFLTPTPAPIISAGLPTAIPPSPTPGVAASLTPAPTSVVAPATPGAGGPVATAPGVATGQRTEAKFTFITPLKPAEEAESAELIALRTELKKVPGFIDISGDELVVTVGFDAGLITADQLKLKFAELKHPVK